MMNFIKQYKWWIIGTAIVVGIIIYRHKAAKAAAEAAEMPASEKPGLPASAPSQTATNTATKEAKVAMY